MPPTVRALLDLLARPPKDERRRRGGPHPGGPAPSSIDLAPLALPSSEYEVYFADGSTSLLDVHPHESLGGALHALLRAASDVTLRANPRRRSTMVCCIMQ